MPSAFKRRAIARGEAPNDRGLTLIDGTTAVHPLAVRVNLPDDVVAVSAAARRPSLPHTPLEPTVRLDG
jgi:hypothetical protein